MTTAFHRFVLGSVTIWTASMAAACGPDVTPGAPDALVTRHDSAGVEIVEVPRAVLDELPALRVEPEPIMTVGVLAGASEEMFGEVVDAALLPDGEVAIADAQQHRVLVFDLAGRFLRAIGREGEGPGEFRRGPAQLDVEGDSLFVSEGATTSVFTFDGRFLTRRSIRGTIGQLWSSYEGGTSRFTRFVFMWISPDGSYPDRDSSEGAGPFPVLTVINRLDTLGGRHLDTLRSADRWWVRAGPFGEPRRHPLAPELWATVLGERPAFGWSGDPVVTIMDPDGTVRRVVRLALDAAPPPAVDARLAAWMDVWEPRPPGIRERVGDVLEAPRDTPFFYRLAAGRDHDLWIAVEPVDISPDQPLWTRWLRLAADGTPLGWMLTPGLAWLELGGDRLIARETDELGVPRVSVHSVVRSGER